MASTQAAVAASRSASVERVRRPMSGTSTRVPAAEANMAAATSQMKARPEPM
jgi:hypothetical protein